MESQPVTKPKRVYTKKTAEEKAATVRKPRVTKKQQQEESKAIAIVQEQVVNVVVEEKKTIDIAKSSAFFEDIAYDFDYESQEVIVEEEANVLLDVDNDVSMSESRLSGGSFCQCCGSICSECVNKLAGQLKTERIESKIKREYNQTLKQAINGEDLYNIMEYRYGLLVVTSKREFLLQYDGLRWNNHMQPRNIVQGFSVPFAKAIDNEWTTFKNATIANNPGEMLNAVKNNRPTSKWTLFKLLHDADVVFTQPKGITKVFFDTETYNLDAFNNSVPLPGQRARLSMVQVGIVFADGSRNKIVYINQSRDVFLRDGYVYDKECVPADVKIVDCSTSQECAVQFFRLLESIQKPDEIVVVCGYNACASLYPTKEKIGGYDLRWLIHEANLDLTLLNGNIKGQTGKDENGQITLPTATFGIQQLPRVLFRETMYPTIAQVNMLKLQPASRGLGDILKCIGSKTQKLEMDHMAQQALFRKQGSDISKVITYAWQDVLCVEELEQWLSDSIEATFAFAEYCNVPAQFTVAFSRTQAQSCTYKIHERYQKAGFHVAYHNTIQLDKISIKGALTYLQQNVDDEIGKEYVKTNDDNWQIKIAKRIHGQNTAQSDLSGAYPAAALSKHLSPENLEQSLENAKDNCEQVNNEQSIVIHLDDEKDAPTYTWKNNRGVLEEVLWEMRLDRIEIKKLAKTATGLDKIKLTLREKAIKCCQNTLYGLLAAQTSPLYFPPSARCITGVVRKTLLCAARFAQQEGGHVFAADTDAIDYVLPSYVKTKDDFVEFENKLNNHLENRFPYLGMTAEEFQTTSFRIAPKSYVWQQVDRNVEWNVVTSEWHEKVKTKSRGFVISGLHEESQRWCTIKLEEFMKLTTTLHNATGYQEFVACVAFYEQVRDEALAKVKNHIANNDLEAIAQKHKLSAKSKLSEMLRNKYPEIPYVSYLIKTHKKGLKTNQCQVPVQFMTERDRNCIDIEYLAQRLLAPFQKLFTKLFSIVPKQFRPLNCMKQSVTQYNEQVFEAVEQMASGKVLVQQQKNKGSFKPDAMVIEDILQLDQSCTFHEALAKDVDRVRFFLDLDHVSRDEARTIIEIAERVVQDVNHGNNVEPFVLWNDLFAIRDRAGVHVYFPISCTLKQGSWMLRQIKYLIEREHQGLSKAVDDKMIARTQLRLPGFQKIGDSQNKYTLPANKDIRNALFTYVEDIPQLPFHAHMLDNAVDSHFREQFYTKHAELKDVLKALLDKHESCDPVDLVKRDSGLVCIMINGLCPLCQRKHTGSQLHLVNRQDGVYIDCFRNKQEEKKPALRILEHETKDDDKEKKIRYLAENQQSSEELDANIVQDKRYLDISNINIEDHRVVAIKSALGTGKSEQILNVLQKMTNEQPRTQILFVSGRRSLTQSFAIRARKQLPKLMSYLDVQNQLSFSVENNAFIVQTDSLERIDIQSIRRQDFILVIDEIETVLSHMHSGGHGLKNLIALLQYPKQCFILDGFLQQATVDLFACLLNTKPFVIENKHVPFNKIAETIISSNHHDEQLAQTIFAALSEKKKVYAFISSNVLARTIAKRMDAFKVLCIHGDNNADEEVFETHAEMKNAIVPNLDNHLVNEDVQLFISTSTISVGVDLQLFKPDLTIASWDSNTCTSFEVAQSIMRARNLQEMKLFIQLKYTNDRVSSVQDSIHDSYGITLCDRAQQATSVQIFLSTRQKSIRAAPFALISHLRLLGIAIELKTTKKIKTTKEQKELREQVKSTRQVELFEYDSANILKPINITKQMITNAEKHQVKPSNETIDDAKIISTMRAFGLGNQQILAWNVLGEFIIQLLENKTIEDAQAKAAKMLTTTTFKTALWIRSMRRTPVEILKMDEQTRATLSTGLCNPIKISELVKDYNNVYDELIPGEYDSKHELFKDESRTVARKLAASGFVIVDQKAIKSNSKRTYLYTIARAPCLIA